MDLDIFRLNWTHALLQNLKWTGKTAPWMRARAGPCKCEGLSLNLQHPCKKMDVATAGDPSTGELEPKLGEGGES